MPCGKGLCRFWLPSCRIRSPHLDEPRITSIQACRTFPATSPCPDAVERVHRDRKRAACTVPQRWPRRTPVLDSLAQECCRDSPATTFRQYGLFQRRSARPSEPRSTIDIDPWHWQFLLSAGQEVSWPLHRRQNTFKRFQILLVLDFDKLHAFQSSRHHNRRHAIRAMP